MTEEKLTKYPIKYPGKYIALAVGSLNCNNLPEFSKLEDAIRFYLTHRDYFRGELESKTIIAKEIGIDIEIEKGKPKLVALGDVESSQLYYGIEELPRWEIVEVKSFKNLKNLVEHYSIDRRVKIAHGLEIKL